MDENELKNQIFNEFKKTLLEIGVTSPEVIQFRTDLPDQHELSKNSEVLSEVGRWKDRVIFSLKKWISGTWKVLS